MGEQAYCPSLRSPNLSLSCTLWLKYCDGTVLEKGREKGREVDMVGGDRQW